jgi:recombination protein RecT
MALPATQQPQNPLDRPAKDQAELKALLTSKTVMEQIKMTLPAHMKPERLAKILLSATLKTPKLMECNQLSLLKVLGNLSELGLEPGGARPMVHLVPFEVSQGKDRAGNWLPKRMDVNIIVDYRGYLELFRRSGQFKDFDLDIVYQGEKFEYRKGFSDTGDDARCLKHEPDWSRDRSSLDGALLVYFIAYFKDGGRHIEVMSIAEVLKIRDRSEGWKSAVKYGKTDKSPWHTDPVRMALKTVIRRASNFLPLSAEAQDALEMDKGEFVEMAGVAVENAVRKPPTPVTTNGDDQVARNWADAASRAQPEDAEIVDPTTGEVTSTPIAQPAEEATPTSGANGEPSLLDLITNAQTKDEVVALQARAMKLDKNDPERSTIGAALTKRLKELAQ